MESLEKRNARVQGYITPSLKQFVEQQCAAAGGRLTESDVVFEALELRRVIVAADHITAPRIRKP